MSADRAKLIHVRMVLACGCTREKDFPAGQDPKASKQRCKKHSKQTVKSYMEVTT